MKFNPENVNDLSLNEDSKIIFNSLDKGIIIINNLGKITFTNDMYKEIFNLEDYQLVGKQIYNTHNDNIIVDALNQRKEMNGYLNFEFQNHQIYVTAKPCYKQGSFAGIISIYEKRAIKKIIKLNVNEANTEVECEKVFESIIGKNRLLCQQLKCAKKVSATDVTVLLYGESGTGKELLAQEIHKNSPRKDQKIVAVNCGAIPNQLIESELFGHKKGAFTGAIYDKVGKFEQASGGTLFLDEIGDLPLDMQVKLLRVLQNKTFVKVGGNTPQKVDVRIIAATHKNLEEMVEKGEFREDLYYRLNVVPIRLPALRERPDDINSLILFLNQKISCDLGMKMKQFSNEVIEALKNYHWPGNIRELENILKRVIIMSDKETIELYDLPNSITKIYHYNKSEMSRDSLIQLNSSGEVASIEEYEKEIIEIALKKYKSFNAAGKVLGVTHKTVAAKARKYNIR